MTATAIMTVNHQLIQRPRQNISMTPFGTAITRGAMTATAVMTINRRLVQHHRQNISDTDFESMQSRRRTL